MEPEKEDAVVALLVVDVWSRYVAVAPLKRRNAQTVGQALVKFISDVSGGQWACSGSWCSFLQGCKGKSWIDYNCESQQCRTSIAERFAQTVKGIQKTLISQIEAAIPAGHRLVQWAGMHSALLYDRYHVHSTMKVTPCQSLHGRPYQGRLACFGQTVYRLDPRASKFKPAWRRGAWIGKDSSGMDLIATDGLCIIRTKAVRKVSDQWDADFLIGMTDGPMDFFGHSQVKARQKIVALSAPSAQEIDEEAEAVRDLPLSEGYSASEPFDYSEVKQRQGLVEGAGLGRCWFGTFLRCRRPTSDS